MYEWKDWGKLRETLGQAAFLSSSEAGTFVMKAKTAILLSQS
jgi:hypothetical protein